MDTADLNGDIFFDHPVNPAQQNRKGTAPIFLLGQIFTEEIHQGVKEIEYDGTNRHRAGSLARLRASAVSLAGEPGYPDGCFRNSSSIARLKDSKGWAPDRKRPLMKKEGVPVTPNS